jgi:hypothetical protein
MNYRLRYLQLPDVSEGMVLGAPLVLMADNGVISLTLPAGHVLNESTLRQLHVRHAEFVCIQVEDERSDEERAAEVEQAEARLKRIFRGADLSRPAVAGLYEALLAYRRG